MTFQPGTEDRGIRRQGFLSRYRSRVPRRWTATKGGPGKAYGRQAVRQSRSADREVSVPEAVAHILFDEREGNTVLPRGSIPGFRSERNPQVGRIRASDAGAGSMKLDNEEIGVQLKSRELNHESCVSD